MKKWLVKGSLVAVALLMISVSLFAHHGNAAYDSQNRHCEGNHNGLGLDQSA